jgi:predicted nucleic acid-binding protein
MNERYYLDTALWVDICEDRKGYCCEDLGESPLKLLILLKTKRHRLVITDVLVRELESIYSTEELNGIFAPFGDILDRIRVTKEQMEEAKKLAKDLDVPPGDALHAIIARDSKLVLVARDNHFRKLRNVSEYYKPEELI